MDGRAEHDGRSGRGAPGAVRAASKERRGRRRRAKDGLQRDVRCTVKRWLLLPLASDRNASSAQRYGFGLNCEAVEPSR